MQNSKCSMQNNRQKPNVKCRIIFLALFFFLSADVFSEDSIFSRVFFKDFQDIGTAIAGHPGESLVYTAALTAVLIPVINNDLWISDGFQGNKNDFNDTVFDYANYAGDGIYVLAGTSLLFLGGEKEKKTAERVIETIAVAGAINYFFKVSIGRERPSGTDNPYLFKPYSFNTSMPSGHTCVAFAWATIIGDNYDIGYITYPIAFLAGMARVYKDKHWASDVIAGAFIGTVTAKIINSRPLFDDNINVSMSFNDDIMTAGISINW